MIKAVARSDWTWPVGEGDWDNKYYKSDYAYLHLQFAEDMCYMHLYVEKWGREVLREMLSDFKQVKDIVKLRGARRMIGIYEGKKLREWIKLMKLLGFPKPKLVYIENVSRNMTIMEV